MVTSGSTGVPAFYYKSLDTVCRRQAIKYRAEEWIGKPIGTRTSLIWGRLPTARPHARVARFLYWWYQNYQFLSAFDIGPRQLEDYVQRITRFAAGIPVKATNPGAASRLMEMLHSDSLRAGMTEGGIDPA